MSKIKQLSPYLIPKIAAGEVAESPASIIKELIENSLDASAQNITIDYYDSGQYRIVVQDDGVGMSHEDLAQCFLPHTTSKIYEESDLQNIKTLGFRGEALASICAVSDVVIKSQVFDAQSGYQLDIIDSQLTDVTAIGMPLGTLIEVNNIFSRVPARKKFLKSTEAEYREVLQLLTNFVLANDTVGFYFYRNGKNVFSFSGNQDLIDRLWWVFGTTNTQNLFTIETQSDYLKLRGYLSKPQLSSYSKDKQFIFVNGRVVQEEVISKAVKDAYGTLLEAKAYPVFLFYLTINTDLVDVNVHPKKDKIKFWNEDYIYNFIYAAVKDSLANANLTYTTTYDTDIFGISRSALAHTFEVLKDQTHPWNPKDDLISHETLQISRTYIAAPSSTGLLLIDQHAAHESILYYQFLQKFKEKRLEALSMELQTPVIINLGSVHNNVLQNNMVLFAQIGFDIEEFGELTYRVNALPDIMRDHNPQNLIQELLDDIRLLGITKELDEKTHKTIAYLACRSAIKAGELLTNAERLNIIDKLEEYHFLYTCPHGRPVKIDISMRDLHKMFKRLK